jgi:hypothetical protein
MSEKITKFWQYKSLQYVALLIICSLLFISGAFYLGRKSVRTYQPTISPNISQNIKKEIPQLKDSSPLESNYFLATSKSKKYALLTVNTEGDNCDAVLMDLAPDPKSGYGLTMTLIGNDSIYGIESWSYYGKKQQFKCQGTQRGYYLNDYQGWKGDHLLMELTPGILTIFDPTKIVTKTDNVPSISFTTRKFDETQQIVDYIPEKKYLLTGSVGYYHGENKDVSILDENNNVIYKVYDPSEYLPINDGMLTFKHTNAPVPTNAGYFDSVVFTVGFVNFKTHDYKESISSFSIHNPGNDAPRWLEYKEGDGYIDIYPKGVYSFADEEDKSRGYFRVPVK